MAEKRTRRTHLEIIKDQVSGLRKEVENKKERKQRLLDRIEADTQTIARLDKEIAESESLIASLDS